MTFRLALTRRGGLPTAAAELKCWATRGLQMILEVAILNVRVGLEREFEAAFAQASLIIASMPGYISHQLQRCIETSNRYALLVNWTSIEAHTIGFRGSPEYQRWKQLLHHFYDPFPTVEHYALAAQGAA